MSLTTKQETVMAPVADLYELKFEDGHTCLYTTNPRQAQHWLSIKDGYSVKEYVTLERFQEAAAGNTTRKLFTCTGCGAEGLDEPRESVCDCGEPGAHWVESLLYSAGSDR